MVSAQAAPDEEATTVKSQASFGLSDSLPPATIHDLDQVVPVPGQIVTQLSGITVKGEAGAGQSDSVLHMGRLTVDSKGHVVKGTGSPADYPTYALNEEALLPSGKYLITYAGTLNVVDLAVGEHKVINLVKLSVPKVDGSYKFQVFLDFNDKQTQSNELLLTWWLQKKDLTFNYSSTDCYGHTSRWDVTVSVDKICKIATGKKAVAKKFCSIWLTGDYTQLNGVATKFKPDGTFMSAEFMWTRDDSDGSIDEDYEKFNSHERVNVADGNDGDFVSLLPGVYGLHMTNFNNQSTDQFGLVLK